MFETIIGALLPIVVALVLGLFAGWHKDFNTEQASILNKMVMTYALPLALFSGMVRIPLKELLKDVSMLVLIGFAMIVIFFVAIAIIYYVFKRDIGTSALQGLAIAGPAVPFVGTPVLGYLFGVESFIPIAISSIIMNVVQVPATLILLSMAVAQRDAATATTQKTVSLGEHVLGAFKKPVVWAPLLALVVIIVELHIPIVIDNSLDLLGKATGGVALFASGAILYAQKVSFSLNVGTTLLMRNIIVPALVLILAKIIGAGHPQTVQSVLAMAIPTASIIVIFAVQYKTAEREMASTLFLSTILSVLTMGGFMWFLNG